MRESIPKLETHATAEAMADKPTPPPEVSRGEPVSPEKQKEEHEPAKVEEFLDKEAEILAAYGLRGDITLERSNNGWAFDVENKLLMYDPKFIIERGYS